jgi:hypothetical protein
MVQIIIVLFPDSRSCFVDVLLQMSIGRRGSPHTTAGSTSLHSDTLIVLYVIRLLDLCLFLELSQSKRITLVVGETTETTSVRSWSVGQFLRANSGSYWYVSASISRKIKPI